MLPDSYPPQKNPDFLNCFLTAHEQSMPDTANKSSGKGFLFHNSNGIM